MINQDLKYRNFVRMINNNKSFVLKNFKGDVKEVIVNIETNDYYHDYVWNKRKLTVNIMLHGSFRSYGRYNMKDYLTHIQTRYPHGTFEVLGYDLASVRF